MSKIILAERKNVTQPSDWWLAFEKEAKNRSQNLSEFIGNACVGLLPEKEQKKLSKRRGQGKPSKSPKATKPAEKKVTKAKTAVKKVAKKAAAKKKK